MENIRLIKPCAAYLKSYLEACREYKDFGGRPYYGVHDPDAFAEWSPGIFDKYERQSKGEDLPEGYVPYTAFWLAEGEDTYLGSGSIRHRLTPQLEKFGGHIGYIIRVSRWGQGLGTVQLKLLLKEANALGINPALMTCDLSNKASARVMEKNGAKRRDVIELAVEGETRTICRYWAATDT